MNHFVGATVVLVTPQRWLIDCCKSADVKEKWQGCASKKSEVGYLGTICAGRTLRSDNISKEFLGDMSPNKTKAAVPSSIAARLWTIDGCEAAEARLLPPAVQRETKT